MLRRPASIAALLATLAVLSAAAASLANTQAGYFTDPTGEADGRPWETSVPPSLDISAAWVDTSDANELIFHIELADLAGLVDAKGWRYYLFTFDLGDGPNDRCKGGSDALVPSGADDLGVLAVISPTGPNNPTHSWWSGCFPRTAEDRTTGYLTSAQALPQGQWRAGDAGNEVAIRLPRFDAGGAVAPIGAQLTGLQVKTWSGPSSIGNVEYSGLGISPRGATGFVLFYPPLPFADVTAVVPGPVTV